MGRRLNQYLGSFRDNGRPKVVFVFDDDEVPEGAEVVYRLNLRGNTAAQPASARIDEGPVESQGNTAYGSGRRP